MENLTEGYCVVLMKEGLTLTKEKIKVVAMSRILILFVVLIQLHLEKTQAQDLDFICETYINENANGKFYFQKEKLDKNNFDELDTTLFSSNLNLLITPALFSNKISFDNSGNIVVVSNNENIIEAYYDINNNQVNDLGESLIFNDEFETKTKLIFKNSLDTSKNLQIELIVSLSRYRGNLYLIGIPIEFLKSKLNLENNEYVLEVRKYLGTPNIKLNEELIRFGDPILIEGSFYSFTQFNYLDNILTFTKQENNKRPTGISKGTYVENERYNNTLKKYGISKSFNEKNSKKTVVHFWGSWCEPCMNEIEEISGLLNKIDHEECDIINVALINKNSNTPEAIDRVKANELIVDQYYNEHIKSINEFKNLNSESFIDIFQNSTYPNIIVLNADNRIIFRENHSQEKFRSVVDKFCKNDID